MFKFDKIKDFWCMKVLPTVYEDSLSYYEVLCKVIRKVNEIIDKIAELPDKIRELIKEEMANYEIPLATRDKIGGIYAEAGDETDSVPVRIKNGFLFVKNMAFTLLKADAQTLGGVKAEPATAKDTKPVHIDNNGFLVVEPDEGGGGGGGTAAAYSDWYNILDIMAEQECNFSAAIEWAMTNLSGGSTVYIPAGEYVATKMLVISAEIRLVGAGSDCTTIRFEITEEPSINVPNTFICFRNWVYVEGVYIVFVSSTDFTINSATSLVKNDTDVSAITTARRQICTFKDVYFTQDLTQEVWKEGLLTTGIWLYDVDTTYLEFCDCTFKLGSAQRMIRVDNSANTTLWCDVYFERCTWVDHATTYRLQIGGTSKFTLSHCEFRTAYNSEMVERTVCDIEASLRGGGLLNIFESEFGNVHSGCVNVSGAAKDNGTPVTIIGCKFGYMNNVYNTRIIKSLQCALTVIGCEFALPKSPGASWFNVMYDAGYPNTFYGNRNCRVSSGTYSARLMEFDGCIQEEMTSVTLTSVKGTVTTDTFRAAIINNILTGLFKFTLSAATGVSVRVPLMFTPFWREARLPIYNDSTGAVAGYVKVTTSSYSGNGPTWDFTITDAAFETTTKYAVYLNELVMPGTFYNG